MKKKVRKKKKDRLLPLVASGIRFWTGILIIPAYLLIQAPLLKVFLLIFFTITASLAGKKIRYLYFLMMTLSITFFHLLTPHGRILWDLGFFHITEGSLVSGFTKGISLAGLVFISLFSVTPSLKLPGKLGGLLGRMFYYFELILDGKKKISARNFIESLDKILEEIFPLHAIPEPRQEGEVKGGTIAGNILYPLVWIVLAWGLMILERL